MSERPGPARRFFDLWSRVYDAPWVQRLTYRPVQDAVARELAGLAARPRQPGAAAALRVLDVGCGTGQLVARLRQTPGALEVIGCDFSEGMLEKARARDPAVRLARADAQHLPFRSDSFDAVISTEAFHWFPDPEGALREFRRVLAPGGRALVALINPPLESISQLTAAGSELIGQPLYWPTRARMRAWVEDAGFQVREQRAILRLPLLLPAILTIAERS